VVLGTMANLCGRLRCGCRMLDSGLNDFPSWSLDGALVGGFWTALWPARG
jgi:hypothetical protein